MAKNQEQTDRQKALAASGAPEAVQELEAVREAAGPIHSKLCEARDMMQEAIQELGTLTMNTITGRQLAILEAAMKATPVTPEGRFQVTITDPTAPPKETEVMTGPELAEAWPAVAGLMVSARVREISLVLDDPLGVKVARLDE